MSFSVWVMAAVVSSAIYYWILFRAEDVMPWWCRLVNLVFPLLLWGGVLSGGWAGWLVAVWALLMQGGVNEFCDRGDED